MSFFDGKSKLQAISWAFFDFANSSYSLLIMTLVWPVFFAKVVAGSNTGDLYWGIILGVSTLLGGLAAPVIGALADFEGRRKAKFIMFTLLAIAGTASFFFTGTGTVLLAALLFMATNFCYELAVTLYDSFLPDVSSKKNIGKISGLGWGLGYIGGIAAMLLIRPLYAGGFDGSLQELYKLSFPATAAFFLVFALPIIFFVKEKNGDGKRIGFFKAAKYAVSHVISTIKHIRKYKNIATFFIAYFFMHDALITIFSFTGIYGVNTFGLSFDELGILFLIIMLIAAPSSLILGNLADRFGAKKIELIVVGMWGVIVLFLSIVSSKTWFYVLSIATGIVIGSSQAVARAWLTKMIPKGHKAEFFGFNGFASKIAAVGGPIIFGSVSVISGSQRLAMLSLLPLFILSFIFFWKVEGK